MCFRLYAAVQAAPGEETATDLQPLAVACGLDVRVAPRGPTRFLEVAWGDCACSLYTRREGRERAVRFVDQLLERKLRVQLLLLCEDGEQAWRDGPPDALDISAFRARALAALPEARVVELRDT